MLVPETVDKLLKAINKETNLPWHWHETVVEPYPIGVAHKIVCEFPVRGGGTGYKWFEVQDILLYTNPELIIEHLKEEVNKVRKEKQMKKKIRFYKALLIEIIETLCTICLYLERDGRYTHNEESIHMQSHFTALKNFSEDLRK